MTQEQKELLVQAQDSLAAARLLQEQGYFGFAASRAYYTMFYVAEAALLEQDLAFSKHSGVVGAFGKHLVKTDKVPAKFHRYLIRGMEVRHSGDYGTGESVTEEECAEQIVRAKEFLELATEIIGPPPGQTDS
jgi:uncharacterized protein (UPF0332 family)